MNESVMLACSIDTILDRVLLGGKRILLFGDRGVGKSTLAGALARTLYDRGRASVCVSADPGSPTFGAPGVIALGEWRPDGWRLLGMEALCTLDAGRFRLPLSAAVRRLTDGAVSDILLIDAPGVVRGVAGAELLLGLIEAARADVVLVLARAATPPLTREMKSSGLEVLVVQAATAAHSPSKRQRARARTRLWDAYLAAGEERRIDLSAVQLVGTPPPIDATDAWIGRQVAVLDRARTVGFGEVVGAQAHSLQVRLVGSNALPGVVLVRDAQRAADGLLQTARPFGSGTLRYMPPPDVRPYGSPEGVRTPSPVTRVGAATATLVNGVFGDPLLHLRLRQRKRSVLFDLGDGGRLPARVAHQVTDVFVSHTHIDHIGGFLWFLRARIGEFPICRLVGPPGLAANIAGLVNGVHWDRIGGYGPRFAVAELHGERLVRFVVQAGRGCAQYVVEEPVQNGIILSEVDFQVRATTLDHRTPVLAFALEQPEQLNVRKERLAARRLATGPWLNELELHLAAHDRDASIRLPNGELQRVAALADELIVVTPGQKLVYATDLADTVGNRVRLTALARGAHVFFCEATFAEADVDKAQRTGHLTARACGEIATAAAVAHLVPFHFSRRYEDNPQRIYDEIGAVCTQVVVPKLERAEVD
jgi:ribonuclease Z